MFKSCMADQTNSYKERINGDHMKNSGTYLITAICIFSAIMCLLIAIVLGE